MLLAPGLRSAHQPGGVQRQEPLLSDGDGNGGGPGSLRLHRPAQLAALRPEQRRGASERHRRPRPGTGAGLTSVSAPRASGGPIPKTPRLPQLFLQRERAAVLAEAQTDDLIKETPKAALDQSGQWQETGGEIQWVANDETEKQEEVQKKKEEEEDEPLDLNKGSRRSALLFLHIRWLKPN